MKCPDQSLVITLQRTRAMSPILWKADKLAASLVVDRLEPLWVGFLGLKLHHCRCNPPSDMPNDRAGWPVMAPLPSCTPETVLGAPNARWEMRR